jgi:hypothetical protein
LRKLRRGSRLDNQTNNQTISQVGSQANKMALQTFHRRLLKLILPVQTQDLGFCWAVLVQPLVLALLALVRLWTTEKRLRFAGLGWRSRLGLERREQTEKCRPPVMPRLLERHKQGLLPLDLRVLAP